MDDQQFEHTKQEYEEFLGSLEGRSLSDLFSLDEASLDSMIEPAKQCAAEHADGMTATLLSIMQEENCPEITVIPPTVMVPLCQRYFILGFLKGEQWRREVDSLPKR